MKKSKSKTLPRTRSLDELVKFFDTHDLGEYWDEMPEVHFEVDIKRRTHLRALLLFFRWKEKRMNLSIVLFVVGEEEWV